MSVQEMIDQKLAEEQVLRRTRESSNKWRPSLMGSCLRRHWYAKTGVAESNPSDARTLRVFAAGKLFHDFVQAFYNNEQKEVLIETETTKGYADLVGEDEVVDIKSQHSKSFWYGDSLVLCTIDNGQEIRVKEGDIYNVGGIEKVKYKRKEYTVVSKRTKTILEEKLNNWLQVCWYAVQLKKKNCKLVFISKDDLCIREYTIPTDKIKDFLDKEMEMLYSIASLPEGKPRLYDGRECSYCNWSDKCKGDGCTQQTTTQ